MSSKEKFIEELSAAYTYKGDFINLGGPMYDGEVLSDFQIKAPLKTMNRHGLIAGATGTGKTKSLQLLAEQLSQKGVPVLVMDMKGDLSGITQPSPGHLKIDERMGKIGIPWVPASLPSELLSISEEPGVKLRATVTEFGPVLLSKILGLSDAQSGTLSMLFKYADDKSLPLIDIKDLRKTLQFMGGDGKEEFTENYGLVSTQSIGGIMRALVALEEQGADSFFGEPSFEVRDLLRLDDEGRGKINILRLTDIQSKPAMFSTFMLSLLAELYEEMPEQGDSDRPELVLFIDEAHLIFRDAPKVLLDQLEVVVKLIRSKGIGVFFITQTPDDIPDEVLGQLGFKLQHALRAFTEKDRKAIKKAAENYPITEYYKADQLLTELGIGEAFITLLNEKGIPTPLAHTMLCAPQTRMDVITDSEMAKLVKSSELVKKYNTDVDRESAYEILKAKIEDKKDDVEGTVKTLQKQLFELQEEQKKLSDTSVKWKEYKKQIENVQKAIEEITGHKKEKKELKKARKEKSMLEKAISSSVGRTVVRELTRGLLGVLGIKSTRRRRKSSWF